MHHSPESFELVIQYVRESEFLKELDLSWTIVKPIYWESFMEVIYHNRTLTNLTLAFNHLMED